MTKTHQMESINYKVYEQRLARQLRKEILAIKRQKKSPSTLSLIMQPQVLARIARARRKDILLKKRASSKQNGDNIEYHSITPFSCLTQAGSSSLTNHCKRKNRLITEAINSVSKLPRFTNGETNNRDVDLDDSDIGALEGYWDIGDPDCECLKCGAKLWYQERIRPTRETLNPRFNICCRDGKVVVPYMTRPPKLLVDLLSKQHKYSAHFIKHIRAYNMMFAFTSMGGKIEHSINRGNGPYTFKLGGQNFHLIGSLLPKDNNPPKFCQLYIHDTEQEVLNRKKASGLRNQKILKDDLIAELKEMLDIHNPLAKNCRMAKDKIKFDIEGDVKLRLISDREKDGRIYNLPTTSEIAALVTGDVDEMFPKRDVIIEYKSGELQCIDELHPSYLSLQYPLLFPYGEDGYRLGIPHSEESIESSTSDKPHNKLTMREWLAFRMQERNSDKEYSTLLSAGKLTQQLMVDGYTMVESHRLRYIRFHQPLLRAEKYNTLSNAVSSGNIEPASSGSRVVVPSSFLGGSGYARESYHDTMSICRVFGYPDLFITFTSNPKWPEVVRFVKKKKKLRPEDKANIIVRIFHIKLQELMRDFRVNNLFGKLRGAVYSIEFQKRGLPHAHILLFLHRDDRFPEVADVDRIISAEIPDKTEKPALYNAVKNTMIHGPCGPANYKSQCMIGSKCSKNFPKKFVERTTVNEEGYPIYKRRDTGCTVEKSGVVLDNRFVVPYNETLMMKYRAHINVEWCNQTRAVKYLFKYISKGVDRVVAQSVYKRPNEKDPKKVDEIKSYYECRYISPCEAMWRVFAFDLHYKYPSVERLRFHLPNEQYVFFEDEDPIDEVVENPTVGRSKFLAWMKCNSEYPLARGLTYSEFPSRFVWKPKLRQYQPRKQGISIGRLQHVPPTCGELHFMRTMLNFVKGPTSFEDIRTVDGIVHRTFRDACYALGLLGDDKEYEDAIVRRVFGVLAFT